MNSYIILICLCFGSLIYSSSSAPSALVAQQDEENKFLHWFRIVKDKVVEIWNSVKNKSVAVWDYAKTKIWKPVEQKADEVWRDVKTEVMDACSCINFNCGCCAHLQIKEIELNSTICVNVTYLVHDYGISFTVTVDKHTIFNETVSGRNPPPVCLGVKYVEELVDACIGLYDIDASTTHLHGCVKFEVWMKIVPLAKYEFGCLNIGHRRSTIEKLMTLFETSLDTTAASHTSSAANTTVIAVAVTAGIILVAVVSAVVIFLIIKRGLLQKRGVKPFRRDLLLNRQQKYGSLLDAYDDGDAKC